MFVTCFGFLLSCSSENECIKVLSFLESAFFLKRSIFISPTIRISGLPIEVMSVKRLLRILIASSTLPDGGQYTLAIIVGLVSFKLILIQCTSMSGVDMAHSEIGLKS